VERERDRERAPLHGGQVAEEDVDCVEELAHRSLAPRSALQPY
jgi:hypothetical protein